MHVIDIEDTGPIELAQNVIASGIVSNDKSPLISKPCKEIKDSSV